MGKVQPLWFGLQIPKESKIGTHKSFIVIKPEGMDADTVYLDINIASNTIDSYGDNNPENMSRLRWLNSTIGSEKDFIIKHIFRFFFMRHMNRNNINFRYQLTKS